tara:strand:- start:366 stop:614 length:249 start_codon:yes stop_codon:yes gene_type:complete
MIVEIPTWLLFVLVFSIVILFIFSLETSYKISRIKFEQKQIGLICSTSFENISKDIKNIDDEIINIHIKYDKIQKSIAKTRN